MLIIPMNHSGGGLVFAKVDDEDYPLLSKYCWWVKGGRGSHKYLYAQGRIRSEHNDGRTYPGPVLMHRLLLGLTDTKIVGDHVNGDTLDNRRTNIRKSDYVENQFNRHHKMLGRSSGYVGVTRRPSKKDGTPTWHAQIKINYKTVYLGAFHDELAAATAYNSAREKFLMEHGYAATIPLDVNVAKLCMDADPV